MPKEKESEDVSEVSEEIGEIIGRVPAKIFVRVTYIMLMIIAAFFLSAYFISYNDKISGEIVLYNESRPLKVVCPQNGQMAKVFVQDGSTVTSGEILALIDNPTNYESIAYLRNVSKDYAYVLNNIDAVIANDNIHLSFGEMQQEYNSLISNLLSYRELMNPANTVKLRSLNAITKRNDSINKVLVRKSKASANEFSKESKRFDDYHTLYESGVISKHEYYNALGNQFNAKMQIENSERDAIQQNLGAVRALQDLNDFAHHLSAEKERLYHEIYANIRNIEVFIRNWDQRYLIRAPKGGKINFLNLISDGQYFKTGDELFAILAPNKGIFGIANIASDGAGNIELNQKARIKIKKYPFYEYGFVEGYVEKINSIPNNNIYKLKITINKVENDKLAEKLRNEEEALGEVDIITKEYTLLDRLFNNVVKTLN
jgi:multidrug resistance efflux pump